MRTEEMLEAMSRHPSGVSDGSGSVPPDAAAGAAYRGFFDALAELNDTVLLYGPGSAEVDFVRARVDSARSAAIRAWRRGQHAA
jgi:hypothetical protein